jgi:hypothetical protein
MSTVDGVATIIPPPDGYEVDFANPQRRLITETYVIFIVENILALAFLGQRLYTKIRLMKQFQIDDGIVFRNDDLESLLTEFSTASTWLGLFSGYSVCLDYWFCNR